MTSIKTVVVSGDITTDTTWLGHTKYIISTTVRVKAGVTLNIYDTAQICFLNGNNFNLIFEPSSRLVAGVITSYSVDSSYNAVTVTNSGGWIFIGTRVPFNGTIPVNYSKFIISSLNTNYLGSSTTPSVSFLDINSWESSVNTLSVNNGLSGALFLFNASVNIRDLTLNNITNVFVVVSVLVVYKKLTVSGGFLGTTSSFLLGTVTVKKCGTINITTPLLPSSINIATTDARVPTTKPYATPYVAKVGELKSKVIFYLTSLTERSLPQLNANLDNLLGVDLSAIELLNEENSNDEIDLNLNIELEDDDSDDVFKHFDELSD